MRKKLILFTTAFPYDASEAFLESELPYLSRGFEQVTIVPIMGRELKRAVPANVRVAKPLYRDRLSQLGFFARLYATPQTWGHITKAWRRALVVDGRRHVAVFYRIFNWASYRTALETHAFVREAISEAEDYVAYSYWAHAPSFALPALSQAGIPCTVRYHRVDLYLHGLDEAGYWHRNARYFPWREEIAPAASHNLFISENGLAYFKYHWPNTTSAVSLNRLGVPDRGRSPAKSSDASALTVVSCSHINPRKRVHLIALLLAEVARERPVTWHHFGDGDTAELIKALQTRPPNLRANLHGWVSNSDLMDFYRTTHVDLFVNLSASEGIPVSIMEAASFGIPAVATDVDGTSEVVFTGRSGLLIHANDALDPSYLAAQVLKALSVGGAISRSDPRAVFLERFCDVNNFGDLVMLLKGNETCRRETL